MSYFCGNVGLLRFAAVGKSQAGFRPIIVGKSNGDPYPAHGTAIAALSKHLGLPLDRERCFPYQR